MGRGALLAYLIAFLAGAPARAAAPLVPSPDFYAKKGGTRVLVLVAPLDARAKAQLGYVEHTAALAVDATDRFEAVGGVDALDPNAASARAAKEQEARKLMAEAKQALDDLDSAKASKLYTDAIAAWQAADLTRGLEGLVEAWTGKAAGHSVSEENPQAKAELEKVLVLAPKTKFSDAQFPPELLKYAESQRSKMARAKGKLTVRTEPPGANVWVDGAHRGVSPVTVEQVPNGQHMVVAGLTGFSMAVDDLPPGDQLLKLKPAELAFQHQAALDRIAKEPDGPQRDAAARELGDTARADQVLLLIVKKGAGPDALDAVGVRLDVKDGHNFSYRTGTFSSQLVRELVELDDPRIDKRPTTHFAGGSSGGGLSGKRIAGIGLLGGAVVAAASWAIFGFSALDRASQFKTTFQIEAMKSNQAASQGRTFALVADLSWAVGAVLLVVGVLLAFTPLGRSGPSAKPKPKEPDPLEEYRRQQDEQRRLDEERAKQKAPEEQKPPPEEQKPVEEKKPDPSPQQQQQQQQQQQATPPPEEKEKKKTPAEERAEKKRKAEEERAEKKRKAEEEKAEKKRKAEEEKQRKADEKKKAEEEKKRAAEEKAKAEEDKKRAAEEEKKRAAEEKKKAEEDKKRAADEEKQRKADEEKKKAEDEQRQKDEAEARRLDEERKKKEEEQLRKDREQEKPKDRPKLDEEDLRNF